MAVTISPITDGNRTYTFAKTAASQKVLDIAEDAAHQLWLNGYGEQGVAWESQTNTQKLAILDQWHVQSLKDLAIAYHTKMEAERRSKITEAQTKYGI